VNNNTPERTAPQKYRASNGLEIFHYSKAETKYVYEEIFEKRVYFRNGINLLPGEAVFDVGANIGLFSMFVQENFKGVAVHAFEPSPVIFEILKANVERYGEMVRVYDCGIAGKPGEARFTFYPSYSIMSGFQADIEDDQKALREGIKSQLKERGLVDVQEHYVETLVTRVLDQKQEQVCQLETISSMIDKTGAETLGLLKIDAEGSEWDILKGIREEHWPKIRQIVMEVHDTREKRSPEIRRLLEQRGYRCVFEQEKQLESSGIFNCYAIRPPGPTKED
jgi:FkbM family methyltransferase